MHKITPTEVKRHEVAALLKFGAKPSEICAKMGYSPDLVRKVDRLRKAGKSLAPNFKGGSRKIRKPDFMRRIEQIFEEKPTQSLRTTAKVLKVTLDTVEEAAKELGFKSYRQRIRALLTKETKIKRVER